MKEEANECENLEILEKYLILLLGVLDSPLKSIIHLEKEMFILSKAIPKLSEVISFEKHYFGPFSAELKDIIENPLYHEEAFIYEKREISLSHQGKEIFNNYMLLYKDNSRFLEILNLFKMTRELYDKLSEDELLFLIYITYPEYKEQSEVSKRLLTNENRKLIASKLLNKSIITEERYKEVVKNKKFYRDNSR